MGFDCFNFIRMPGRLPFCDAGINYNGKLSENEILAQIDYLIRQKFPDGKIPIEKFKIQFARMGEPSFNENTLKVLRRLPDLYDMPGFIPSISTVAPNETNEFFRKLLKIKKEKYQKSFQLQFSIHTTDEKLRDWIIPVKKWGLDKIAKYGKDFYDKGGRKITLNFAVTDKIKIDRNVLLRHFSPDMFIIKITPVNPTHRAKENNVYSPFNKESLTKTTAKLRDVGYEVILSVGELEENYIGSNCGQYITAHKEAREETKDSYFYKLQKV